MEENNQEVYEEDIRKAAADFEEILRSQLSRCRKIRESEDNKTNLKEKKKIVIGLTGGDGIGPILMKEAKTILEKIFALEIKNGKIELKEIQGFTLERRLAAGETVPSDVLCEMKKCDVLLKGPTTTPSAGKNSINLESANVFLRKEFDLFANIRPVNIPEEGIDWTFFRENTEGEYALGSSGIRLSDELSVDFKVTTNEGTRRIAKAAFDFARNNGKKRVSIVTKANIMKKTDGNFLRVCREVANSYPDIEMDSWFVDIMAANLINKNIRNKFEIFVLPNLYGDIITDEAAEIQGGVGTAGSANVGTNYAIFEAIHGSAPRMVEDGLADRANPASLLKAAAMMVAHIGYEDRAKKLNSAISRADELIGARMTGFKDGATTREYGEIVGNYL